MFDLTRLRLLRELAHRGTMTAVAAAFDLTSSAVSQQLATMEREARVPLLERLGRRVRAPRITHTVDDYDLLLRMVSAGPGVGFVPELGLRFPSAEAAVVRTPAGAPLTRRVHALTRGALTASPLVRALLSELASTTECAPSYDCARGSRSRR